MTTRLLPLLLIVTGCGAVATNPTWVGGGMAVTGPVRIAEQEATWSVERAKSEREPDEISARHVLVMHKGSQARPEGVTRSREEAMTRAKECLAKIRGSADFNEMVNEYSDEPGARQRQGDLGKFKRGTMVQAFGDAAFTLKVGEVSDVVETAYGFHIIKRTR